MGPYSKQLGDNGWQVSVRQRLCSCCCVMEYGAEAAVGNRSVPAATTENVKSPFLHAHIHTCALRLSC